MIRGMRDSLSVLTRAGRLLAAHWPALLTLGLLGAAVRNGALWGAVEMSQLGGSWGDLFLVLVPLGYLLPVIGMLWVCARSLPHIAAASGAAAPASDRRRLIDVALSVLVPFLVIYEVEGHLEGDRAEYVNNAAADEFFNDSFVGPDGMDLLGRVGVPELWQLGAIVAAAFVARWLLGLLETKVRFLGLAILGGCIEIYWTAQVADYLASLEGQAAYQFLHDRRLFVAASGAIAPAAEQVAALSWLGEAVRTVAESLDVVLVAPMAWLAVGAVVLGHRLMDPPSTRHGILDRLTWLPGPVRNLLASLTQDVRERLGALWNGVRMILRGGLGPMLAFCLAYLVATRAGLAVSGLVRAVTGPVDNDTWIAFAPIEAAAGRAVALALAAVLVASTVDVLYARGLVVADEPDAEADPGSGAAAGSRETDDFDDDRTVERPVVPAHLVGSVQGLSNTT